MKKLFSIFFVMLMLVSAMALAEIPENWQVIPMNDISMQFSIPEDFEIFELTDEDYEEGLAFAAGNDTTGIVIYCFEDTLEETAASLAEEGFTISENGLAEVGLPYAHIIVTDEENPGYAAICFMGSDGYIYMFVGESEDEAGFDFGMILASIVPME